MIKSMTGYGIGSHENTRVKYTVEIKSLNSKFLELNIRVPKTVSDKELTLRTECTKLIERGKVNIFAAAEYSDSTAQAASINADLLKKYYVQLQQIADDLGDKQVSLFELALNMPEVIASNDDEIDEEEGQVFLAAFYQALEKFNTFRADEGSVLRQDLENRTKL